MRVLRGRATTIMADRRITEDALSIAVTDRVPTLRVWTPHRQVSFGRRDTRSPGYQRARQLARDHGFEPVERIVGGRAAAFTDSSLAFVIALPGGDSREGPGKRFDRVIGAVQRALWRVGVPAHRGEPPRAFCPGNHSLSYRGKIVGIAQRVRKDAALVGGVCIVAEEAAIVRVLAPVYEALAIPFDPETVGSIARAGGNDDPLVVARAIETRLMDGHAISIERIDVGDIDG